MTESTLPTEEHGEAEHRDLRHILQRAEASGGRTGEAATAVMKVLFPHMVIAARRVTSGPRRSCATECT